jgi:tetratricopeptide (TPR) repeat protein
MAFIRVNPCPSVSLEVLDEDYKNRVMKAAIGILIFIWFVSTPFFVNAESAGSLVTLGNELYTAGEYEKALEAYEKARAEQPDSGEVFFNEGNAYFRKGEYDKAREAYQSAALKTKDLSLEAFAHYNLGNSIFAEGQKQLETDPRKALSQWEQSIQHFQEALRIDPRLNEAAQNIEVVRISIKDLADRIKKAEESAREQQRQHEEVRKQLDEVIREQESELKENESLQQKAGQNAEASVDKEARRLASDQEKTRQKTGEIADKLKELRQQQQQSQKSQQQPEPSGQPTQEHLERAQEAQRSAVEKLDKQDLAEAIKSQEEALQELKDALSKPEDSKSDQGQCQNPQAGGQDGEEGSEDKQQKEAAPADQSGEEKEKAAKPAQQQQSTEQKSGSEQKESGESGSEQKMGGVFRESPENILREEKENRLQLHRALQGGHRPVEKDW